MGIRYFHNLGQESPWSMYNAVNPDTGAYAAMSIARGGDDVGYPIPHRITFLQ